MLFRSAYKIIEGNDPGMMHTWFVQAEDRAYIQNGYQNAIAWDGVLGTLEANQIQNGDYCEIVSVGTTNFMAIGAASNTVGVKFTAVITDSVRGTGTGTVKLPAYRLNPYLAKMPIGTIMEYAFGRVFVADRYNQIYEIGRAHV